VNSRLGPVSELTKRTPLQRQGRAAASAATRGASRPARENVTHAPAASPHPRPNWPSRPRSYRITTPPVALEGDHATRRTVGSDPSPHEPSGETRCVVPRPQGDGARRRPRGEPATGDGAAHLPPDPPVSSHDVVGRDPAPQCAAPAGELGIDLRRVPELQRARTARPAPRPTGVPPVQRFVSGGVGGFGLVRIRSGGGNGAAARSARPRD